MASHYCRINELFMDVPSPFINKFIRLSLLHVFMRRMKMINLANMLLKPMILFTYYFARWLISAEEEEMGKILVGGD